MEDTSQHSPTRRLVFATIRDQTYRPMPGQPIARAITMSRDLLAARTGLDRDRAARIADHLARHGYIDRWTIENRVYYLRLESGGVAL
jgi:hypothetical protein